MLVNTKRIGSYTLQFKASNYAMYTGPYDLQVLSEELEERVYSSFKDSNVEIGDMDNIVQAAVVLSIALICIERWSDDMTVEIVEE
jgi:hypothetical protein